MSNAWAYENDETVSESHPDGTVTIALKMTNCDSGEEFRVHVRGRQHAPGAEFVQALRAAGAAIVIACGGETPDAKPLHRSKLS